MHRLTVLAIAGGGLLFSACAGSRPVGASVNQPTEVATNAGVSEPLKSGIERSNYYREMSGLPPIAADPKLSNGARLHSIYLIKNHIQRGTMSLQGGDLHVSTVPPDINDERPGNPWFTKEGAEAARRADVLRGPPLPTNGARLVDQVVTLPFSVLVLLNPQLSAIGYGSYCEHDECAATLSYRIGLTKSEFVALYEGASGLGWNPALGPVPYSRARLRKPVKFPPNGATISYNEYRGGTLPDPLTACPGYEPKTGPPVVLELGAPYGGGISEITLGRYSFAEDGQVVESCGFDATTYSNPHPSQQQVVHGFLYRLGAVILIPRRPLKSGHTYTVSINADSTDFSWSFHVTGQP